MSLILLDGAIGTELEARGLPTGSPGWTAAACDAAPQMLAALHRAYAEAGATVHTANTFRTTPRGSGADWARRLARSVAIAREAIGPDGWLAGSLAPLEDCWHPERSPPEPEAEHAVIARALAEAGVDLLLCETFAHTGEALAAVRAALATGCPTWLALTAGPSADLLDPPSMAACAAEAAALGVEAVLVNCVPASRIEPLLDALVASVGGLPVGVYANAGDREEGLGWGAPGGPERYADLARRWVDSGATLIGGCCGTGPDHIRALRQHLLR